MWLRAGDILSFEGYLLRDAQVHCTFMAFSFIRASLKSQLLGVHACGAGRSYIVLGWSK